MANSNAPTESLEECNLSFLKQETDHYKILGVPKNADKRAINAAYRKLSLLCHPDKHSENMAEYTLVSTKIGNAHETIDKKLTKLYDFFKKNFDRQLMEHVQNGDLDENHTYTTPQNHKVSGQRLLSGANINYRFEDGKTLLLEAAASATNSKSMVKLLIKYKATLDTKDDEGNTALSKAFDSSHIDAMIVLINEGASIAAVKTQISAQEILQSIQAEYNQDKEDLASGVRNNAIIAETRQEITDAKSAFSTVLTMFCQESAYTNHECCTLGATKKIDSDCLESLGSDL